MSKRALIIMNPCSGTKRANKYLTDIVETFTVNDYVCTVLTTTKRGDGTLYAQTYAPQVDLITCIGGDGTFNEVVSGLVHSGAKVPIGYIPAGSTNDFATSLGIPKDMVKAADAAVNGRTFPCDIGAFNNDYFVYVAAFGLFTEVSYKTSQEWKNVLGHAAYILEGMRSLHDIPSFTMQVEYNNVRIQDEFIYGMISNSTSVGGFKGMTGKDVRLDDGVFEVTLIKKPRNPIELNEIIASLINLVDDTDMIYSFKTDEVEFMAREEVPWTLDGEFGGAHEEVIVKNICRAVDIMVPANK